MPQTHGRRLYAVYAVCVLCMLDSLAVCAADAVSPVYLGMAGREPISSAGAAFWGGAQNGGGWGGWVTEVSKQRAGIYPHPSAAARELWGRSQ